MIATSKSLRPLILSSLAFIAAPFAPDSAHAASITIDFDSLPAMGNSPGASIPAINRLSDQFLLTTGAVFSSGVDYVAVVDDGRTTSPPNFIGGANPDGSLNYAVPITIRFFDPANPTAPGETDFFSVRGDTAATSDGTATLNAFDLFGNLLASITQPDSNAGLTLSIALSGIHEVRISQNAPFGSSPGSIGFDDVTFNPVQPVQSVPEAYSPVIFLGAATIWVSRRQRPRKA